MRIKQPPTLHLKNKGRTNNTTAVVRCGFGSGWTLFNLAFSPLLIHPIFNLAFVQGRTSIEFPPFTNTER